MKKKYINLILIISILVTLSVIATFIFFFKVIQNKNEHTSKVLTVLAEKMTDKKNNETLVKKFSEIEAVNDGINSYFVDQTKMDTFVDYLEKLGSNNNTELSVKNVEVSTRQDNVLLVKVLINGNFTNVMRVIYLLENAPYNISLTQAFVNKEITTTEVDVKGIRKETGSSSWQASVSFSILSLPKL